MTYFAAVQLTTYCDERRERKSLWTVDMRTGLRVKGDLAVEHC